jgi:hypothetical protein
MYVLRGRGEIYREPGATRRPMMSKHPIDHDHKRDDAKVAKEYARIEREHGAETADPKVRAMTKGAHAAEGEADATRVKAFLKIDRQKDES